MLFSLLYTVIFATSFILVISALVFFHELGHYSVARAFNIAVERFSIGFGKPLAKWTAKSGTEWTINSIPLGGYVKFLGDAGAASNPDIKELERIKTSLEAGERKVAVEDCFHFKPLWQRVLVVLAGPMANFILAIIIFAGLAQFLGTQDTKSVVIDVQANSAAEAAGVKVGDTFITMDGNDVSMARDLISYVALRSDTEIEAVMIRDDASETLMITPRSQEREDFIGGKNKIGTIGVRIGGRDAIVTTQYNPLTSLTYGVSQVGETIGMTGRYIGRIFTGREDGKALGGVVRIATMTGKTAVDSAKLELPIPQRLKIMVLNLIQLSAALSIGLGVANLMPIPVLDGGHLLYYGYEAVAGRPLDMKKQELGFKIGFAFLLTLMVVLTWNDIEYIRSLLS